jgi:hypothetical protein
VSNLATALLEAQKAMPHVRKDDENPHFKNKFASLNAVLDTVLPILNDKGLVLSQLPTAVDGQPALRTVVIHAESGESIEDTMLLVLAKNDPQAQGSALSYARRYSILSTLGLVTEDDDGAAASKPKKQVVKDDDFPFEANSKEKPDPKVLAEIRKLAVDLVEDKSSEGKKLQGDLAKLSWREDPTEAQMAVAKLRLFFSVAA